MSDFDGVPQREEPQDGAHDAVRDALPALLHGRVTASERAALEVHLAACDTCDAELQLLTSARALYVDAAPSAAVDRIAAAVRARTASVATSGTGAELLVVRRAAFASRTVATPRAPTHPARMRHASTRPVWTRTAALRACAASALLAIGSGALLYHSPVVAPARRADAVASVPATTIPSRMAEREASGSVLGTSFADLSDSELAAVVAAVDDPSSSAPAAEPTPVTPGMLTPDGE